MLRPGVVGLGRLGLPFAVTLAQRCEYVWGYDINPELCKRRVYEHREDGPGNGKSFQQCFEWAPFFICNSLKDLIDKVDIIFVVVQTPHEPDLDGTHPVYPNVNKDFDYTHLKEAVKQIAEYVRPDQVVVIVSTVLPGTTNRELLPFLKGKVELIYNPAFPAMGTVMKDILNAEFVLLGCDNWETGEQRNACQKIEDFWEGFYGNPHYDDYWAIPPIRVMSIESAELSKVAYNCAISTKIVLANTLMEICHKVPKCSINDVTNILKISNRRIVSTKYMDAGMGDGGGCHPRDAIAMSWLATELRLSYNLFGQMMVARDEHTKWLCRMVREISRINNLPLVLLGKSYKPESNLTAGSPGLLAANILEDWGVKFTHYDPFVDHEGKYTTIPFLTQAVYFITTKHEIFKSYKFEMGSVVVDPFRYIPDQEGVKIIRIGEGK